MCIRFMISVVGEGQGIYTVQEGGEISNKGKTVLTGSGTEVDWLEFVRTFESNS